MRHLHNENLVQKLHSIVYITPPNPSWWSLGIHKLVSPERNYNNAHERLLDDLHEYRTKIKLLEEELLRYKGSKIIEDFQQERKGNYLKKNF